MFWTKQTKNLTLNSDEYERVNKRIIELRHEIEELAIKYKILETNYNNLRGNFNRKLNKLKEEEEPEETEKDINNQSVLLPHGSFG
jgi:archaellum component FlaC